VLRRQRFEQAYPEAVILPPSAGRWRAIVPPGLIPGDGTRTTLGACDLGDLMDQLDAIHLDSGKNTTG
jgi:hypothetical protein